MPLFGRRRNASGDKLAGNHQQPGSGRVVGTPFRFGSWLRLHGVDIITMALLGAIALGVYFAGKLVFFLFLLSCSDHYIH